MCVGHDHGSLGLKVKVKVSVSKSTSAVSMITFYAHCRVLSSERKKIEIKHLNNTKSWFRLICTTYLFLHQKYANIREIK